ncbi:MAG: RluA family pseudouridine synthase [Dehalococcoidia bacterium]
MGDAVGTPNIATRRLTAPESGRLDAVLAGAFDDLSRARVQRLIESGNARVNGAVAHKALSISEGAEIELDVPETPHETAPTGLNLRVLYEDGYLAVIDKPAGLAVHGAAGDTSPTVAAWWLEQLGAAAAAFDVERPGIVHRLDKDTTGVLVLAKTPQAQMALSGAFEARTTKKTYVAVVDGVPDRPKAVIDAPIDRHPGDRTRMAIVKRGREARTAYEMLHTDNRRSFLEVRPETGRTHQIRVHLAAVGIPVMDDVVYGKREPGGRQMLHAYQLSIPHPAGGTLTVTARIPFDLDHAVRAIGGETLALHYAREIDPVLEPASDSKE